MIVPLLQPVAASLFLVAGGPVFPNFQIERICQTTVTVERSHLTLHGCRHDERAARDNLRQRWTRIPIKYREGCVGDALSVSPSYVDLQGCIDDRIEVRREKKRGLD